MDAFFSVSLPIFGLMFAGWLAAWRGLVGQSGASAINGFVYYGALPALFFKFTATAPMGSLFIPDYLAVVACGYGGAYIIAALVQRLFFSKRVDEIGLAAGCAVFSNTGYMGIPLVLLAFGDEAALLAISGVLVNAVLVFMVVLGALEWGKQKESGKNPFRLSLLITILKNPLLLATLLGLLWAVAAPPALGSAELPLPFLRFLDLLGDAAGPAALFAMGMFLKDVGLKANLPEVLWVSLFKLVIHPVITLGFAVFVWPLSGLPLAIAMVMAALPTGALMYLLADRYHCYQGRAAAVIFVSTIMAVITVSWVLTYFGISS